MKNFHYTTYLIKSTKANTLHSTLATQSRSERSSKWCSKSTPTNASTSRTSWKNAKTNSNKKPKIDPYLIMDDIMEKLKLLDYENDFCARFGKDKIVRIYFAFKDASDDAKVEYFFDLCYWLMSFPGSSKRIRKVSFGSFQNK